MIHIHHENEGSKPYLCLNCCGVETVVIPNDREKVWKHLEDFHDWPESNKEILHIWELRENGTQTNGYHVGVKKSWTM